jgi:hypothetical protein
MMLIKFVGYSLVKFVVYLLIALVSWLNVVHLGVNSQLMVKVLRNIPINTIELPRPTNALLPSNAALVVNNND